MATIVRTTVAGMVVSAEMEQYVLAGDYPADIADDCRALAPLLYLHNCCETLFNAYEVEIAMLGSLLIGWESSKMAFLADLHMAIVARYRAVYRARGIVAGIGDYQSGGAMRLRRIEAAVDERIFAPDARKLKKSEMGAAFDIALNAPIDRAVLVWLRDATAKHRAMTMGG